MANTDPPDPQALMRAVAARLMGNSNVTLQPPPPTATTPRALPSKPSPAAPTPSNVAAPATPAFGGLAPLSIDKAPTPAVEISDPAAYPPLFTADQLAEAKEFSEGATRGVVRKPRPGKGTRERATDGGSSGLSSSLQSSYTTSAPKLPRTRVTSTLTGYRSPGVVPPGNTTNDLLVPTAKPNSKEIITFGKRSALGNAVPPLVASALGNSIVASNQKAAEPLSPASSPVKPALTASQADRTPPHLRWNAFAKNGAGATAAQSAIAQQEEVKKEVKKESAEEVDAGVKQSEFSRPVVPSACVKKEPSDSEYVVINSDPDQNKSFSSIAAETTTASSAGNTGQAVANVALEKLLAEFPIALNRIADLEQEHFTMQTKVEELVQIEERRRYLGTSDSKAPFELSVKYRNAYYKVQANAALKVADLIRRLRVVSNTSPVASPEPRLVVDGEQVGHVLTLHEAGITVFSSVEFVHAGAIFEEDEEL